MLWGLFSIVSFFFFNQNTTFWLGSQLISWEPQLLNTLTDGKFFAGKTGTNDYEFLVHMMSLTWCSYVPLQIWFLFPLSHFQNGPMGSKQAPAVAWVSIWHHQCSLKDSWHKGPCWCNGCMPVRAECKPHSPDLKRGALATDARGCSLWRSLLERPPPAPASQVRDPLGELVRTRVGGVTLVPSPGWEWGLGGWV